MTIVIDVSRAIDLAGSITAGMIDNLLVSDYSG